MINCARIKNKQHFKVNKYSGLHKYMFLKVKPFLLSESIFLFPEKLHSLDKLPLERQGTLSKKVDKK